MYSVLKLKLNETGRLDQRFSNFFFHLPLMCIIDHVYHVPLITINRTFRNCKPILTIILLKNNNLGAFNSIVVYYYLVPISTKYKITLNPLQALVKILIY